MTSNSSAGESRCERLANSSIVRRSSRRWIDVSTNGTASVMNPGLLPVLWIEVPPSAHAASTRSRTAGSRLAGRWNSPRVVTTFKPDASSWQTSSKSQACGMYSTQSEPRARISSTSFVAKTSVASSPQSSPASRPALSGLCTYTPVRVMFGCLMTARRAPAPMLPVAHWMTRYRGADPSSPPLSMSFSELNRIRTPASCGGAQPCAATARRARERKPSSLSSVVRTRVFRDMIETSCPAAGPAQRTDCGLAPWARGRTGRTSTSASRSRGSSCGSRRRERRWPRNTASSSSGAVGHIESLWG